MIFVSIASYDDFDLENTVNDLFSKSKYPDNLNVFICNQYTDREYIYNDKRVNCLNIRAEETKGVCFARSLIQKEIRNEDYFFQLDSHMRFVQNWDEILLNLHKENSVLSSYSLPFCPINKEYSVGSYAIIKPGLFHNRVLELYPEIRLENEEGIGKNFFIGAHLLFTTCEIAKKVKYDPNLYFLGEEISLSVRYYTHGYDIYYPKQTISYHWFPFFKMNRRSNKHRFDYKDKAKKLLERNNSIIAAMLLNKDVLYEYGLGTKRRLEEYEEESGLDFTRQTYLGMDRRRVRNNPTV